MLFHQPAPLSPAYGQGCGLSRTGEISEVQTASHLRRCCVRGVRSDQAPGLLRPAAWPVAVSSPGMVCNELASCASQVSGGLRSTSPPRARGRPPTGSAPSCPPTLGQRLRSSSFQMPMVLTNSTGKVLAFLYALPSFKLIYFSSIK